MEAPPKDDSEDSDEVREKKKKSKSRKVKKPDSDSEEVVAKLEEKVNFRKLGAPQGFAVKPAPI